MESLLLSGGGGTLGVVLFFLWRKVNGHKVRMDKIDEKLDRIAEDTAYIRGRLNGKGR